MLPSYGGNLVQMNVTIDIKIPRDLIDNISKEFVDNLPKALHQIGLEGHTYWTQLASQRLKTSRRDYIQALSYQVTGNSVQIVLGGAGLGGNTNTAMVSIELGGPSFDMKPGFLNSSKAKTGKRKFPRGIAASLPETTIKGLNKYMIVPIMPGEQVVASASSFKFRTVSSNSPPESWWHPGWKGVKLADEVIEELNTNIIPDALRPLLDKM